MNENVNLTKILKNCPKGWEFYSSIHGVVNFEELNTSDKYPVIISYKNGKLESFGADGRLFLDYAGECVLFPSKDQRDWSKFERFWDKSKKERFDPKTLQPFDKVLVKRCGLEDKWMCNIFSFYDEGTGYDFECLDDVYENCIPYNEETKHLVGTTEDCPEYYKWWEK